MCVLGVYGFRYRRVRVERMGNTRTSAGHGRKLYRPFSLKLLIDDDSRRNKTGRESRKRKIVDGATQMKGKCECEVMS